MSEIDMRIMAFFDKVIPKMSPEEKERLLCFGEGMAFMADKRRAEQEQASA